MSWSILNYWGSVPKGNFAQRGISGLAEGIDGAVGGTSAQQFVDRSGLGHGEDFRRIFIQYDEGKRQKILAHYGKLFFSCIKRDYCLIIWYELVWCFLHDLNRGYTCDTMGSFSDSKVQQIPKDPTGYGQITAWTWTAHSEFFSAQPNIDGWNLTPWTCRVLINLTQHLLCERICSLKMPHPFFNGTFLKQTLKQGPPPPLAARQTKAWTCLEASILGCLEA